MPPYGEFIFGHEYAGDVVAVGSTVDEFRVGDRVVVEAHMGCRRCENCIRGLYTACLNFGNTKRGHRANGFTTNGGLAEYALNHINTLFRIPDSVSYDEAVVVVTAGSPLYGLERACELTGTARIQGRDWYHEGALQLLAQQQPNGSIRGEGDGLLLDSTCFALLFLKKATLPAVTTGR